MKYLLENTHSKRLSFRRIEEKDFDDWLPFFSNEEAIKYYPFPKSASNEQLCREWLDRQFKRYKEESGGFNALINEEGSMVGHCGLLVQEVDVISELEIGYALLPEFWGMGYAIEAAKHCKSEAQKNKWAKTLISIIHPKNIPSIRVAQKNGMAFEKYTTFKTIPVGIWRTDI